MDEKKTSRRNLLAMTLPFALPIADMKLTFEQTAMAQTGDSAAILKAFKDFMASYEGFKETFGQLQGTVAAYHGDYKTIKEAYNLNFEFLKDEMDKIDKILEIDSVEKFLDAELPDLSGSVGKVITNFNKVTSPFEGIIKDIRKETPKRSNEVMPPKEVKFHISRETRARNSLGKSAAIRTKEKSKEIKQETRTSAKGKNGREKTAGKIFLENSGGLLVDALQNINETMLRIEESLIRAEERTLGIKTTPKEFGDEEWVKLLKDFRNGKGTLGEVDG